MHRPATPEDLAALARAEAAAAETEANPRSPMLSGPKRQHFLPRFYLEGFSRNGLLAVFDREKKEIRLQQPENTAVIGHFYTLEDAEGRRRFEIEALLSDYEGKASPVIRKLIAREDLTADERSDLAIFIAFAAMRTPDMVNSVQAMNGHFIAQTAKAMFQDIDQVLAELRTDKREENISDADLRRQAEWMVDMAQNDKLIVQTDEKWAVRTTIRMAMAAAPYLAGRDWRVVHRDNEKQSFITTDAPVFLGTVAPRPTSIYGVGFGSQDAFVSFPLEQSCVLQMYGETGNLEHKEAGRDYIRQANLALGERCQRFLVGRDQELVKSLTDVLGLADKTWQSKIRI